MGVPEGGMAPVPPADLRDMAYAVASDWTRGADFGQGLRAALRLAQEPQESMESAQQDAISPELALVCPELRRIAIEALPDRDPGGFVPPRRPVELDVAADLHVETEFDITQPARRGAHVMTTAAACVAVEAARMSVFGIGAVGGVAGLVALATVLPGA
jgi:hypothetical protein